MERKFSIPKHAGSGTTQLLDDALGSPLHSVHHSSAMLLYVHAAVTTGRPGCQWKHSTEVQRREPV
jgi:hypothetical protein